VDEPAVIELLRFGLIVFIAAVDNVAHEILVSFNAARDHARDRWRGGVRKIRARLRRR
jgi:hypothetical protein